MRQSTTTALTVALSVFLSIAALAAEKPVIRVGDPFPSRALPGLRGPSMKIPDDLNGKVTIVHFWTDWCGSCREEMPALEALYNRYKGRGFQVVAINVGQTRAQVKKFIDDMKLTYVVLMDGNGDAAKDYGVVGLPRTFILDRNGIIRYKILGEADEESIRKLLVGLL
jgi:cytochrome c biogenesis protein CcmG, thiol:disulfide interchange protein DsbE